MASMLFRPLLRPQTLGLCLGMSLGVFHSSQRTALRLDSSSALTNDRYKKQSQVPILQNGKLNPGAVRQISSGSILGLLAGVAVSTFSRSLALAIGLLVIVVQWASSYGLNIVPFNKLQRYVTSVDLRSAVQDNVAFKFSFGTTFAMAAFLKF